VEAVVVPSYWGVWFGAAALYLYRVVPYDMLMGIILDDTIGKPERIIVA